MTEKPKFTPWDEKATTEYMEVELQLREATPHGCVAALSVSSLGSWARLLPEPPLRDLADAAAGAELFGFGQSPTQFYGRQLFDWVFDGSFREGFIKARQAIAEWPCTRLRVHVRCGAKVSPKYADLRWETLLYQKDDWRAGLETAFARTLSTPGVPLALVAERPIQLFAAARPADPGSDPLGDLWSVFTHHTTRPLDNLLAFRTAPTPLTFVAFESGCAAGRNHCVVLFAPFSDVSAEQPQVWFDSPAGGIDPVAWDRVADAICGKRPPEMVAVLGPRVGVVDAAAPGPRLAAALHDRGVRAVLEVVGPLAAAELRTFADAFFGRLLITGALDEAVTLGRRALFQAAPDSWAWVLPILSLRSSPDGQLFYLLPEGLERTLQGLSSKRPAN